MVKQKSLRQMMARAEIIGAKPKKPLPRLPFDQWAQQHLASYFKKAPSRFHCSLSAELASLHATRGQRLNVLAPRGAAKSTWSTLAYPLYCALHRIEPFIVLTADSGDQARLYLSHIKEELLGNPSLESAYPNLARPGPVWREDRITLTNGTMIQTLGTGAKARGRRQRQNRPSLVVVDDPQNLDHIISPCRRERSWNWLNKDLLNMGSPDTNVVVLGTALHAEGIVCRLQNTPGWKSQLWKALMSWPDRMDLWREWEMILFDHKDPEKEKKARAFYERNRQEMDKGADPLWPDHEPLYDLMVLRATIGPAAFESEKQNNPIDPSLSEWPEEYFTHPQFWFDEWPENLGIKTTALDPSKGRQDRHGDFQAHIKFGRDAHGIEYVECFMERQTTEAMCAQFVAINRSFRPHGASLEINGFQELLAVPLRSAMLTQCNDTALFTVENTAPKRVRIITLTPPLHARKMRFKRGSPGTQALVQQLRLFPLADHDDGPDCLEMARRLAIELHRGSQPQRAGRR